MVVEAIKNRKSKDNVSVIVIRLVVISPQNISSPLVDELSVTSGLETTHTNGMEDTKQEREREIEDKEVMDLESNMHDHSYDLADESASHMSTMDSEQSIKSLQSLHSDPNDSSQFTIDSHESDDFLGKSNGFPVEGIPLTPMAMDIMPEATDYTPPIDSTSNEINHEHKNMSDSNSTARRWDSDNEENTADLR